MPGFAATPKFTGLEIYEKLWNEAVSAYERGEQKIDPHLPDKAKDARRGVTLIFRPPVKVQDAVANFVGKLKKTCPGQYFYRPQELHITVTSIITMIELWELEMDRFEKCRPIIGDVITARRPFGIRFQGVTASPDSILVQGFPLSDGLTAIRTGLREACARAGFGDMLDRRYKVTAAHISIMRFCRPCPEMKRLLAYLKENRETRFGECKIDKLELIFGDWYASADKVKTLEEYRLT